GRIPPCGEINLVLDQEALVGGGVFIDAHAEDESILCLDMSLKSLEGIGFGDAGRAPARPKIENHYFAFEVGKASGLSVELERKIVRFLSGDGCFAHAITGHGEEQ